MKKIIHHYLHKFYGTAKKLYIKEIHKHYTTQAKQTPIIIYTNGKVGSATIYKSLEKNTQLPVFHIHHLNKKYLSEYEKYVRKHFFKQPGIGNYLWTSLLWRPLFIRKEFLNKKPLKFIIVWRDPVAKNISTFFEWIHFKEDEQFFYFHSHQYEMQFDIKTPKNDVSLLIEYFIQNFPHTIHENWLQIEQEQTLQMPYKNYDFDKEKNFQRIQKHNNEALILKLEHFQSEEYPKIISEFCGIENFQYENANLTQHKAKNKAYVLFKEQIKLPESLLDSLYTSDFMKHYYSEQEIQDFQKLWSR